MSKFVKNIITEALKKRLSGVENALLVNMVGMEVNDSNKLRGVLAEQGVNVMVVKNSLAARATEGAPLNAAFKGLSGTAAICWGASDIVALAKVVVNATKDKQFSKFTVIGGVLDGEAFAAEQAVEISKWPSREEQIAILLGQITGVASKLSSQLLSQGANLASQIKQIWDKDGEDSDAPAEEAPAA
ncbi:MAG: 50S ribosomal protein L10 [Thermoguttaceae bacterium]|nr:50S ribosomal protein L10 [Thermoguttaceae bacterium]